METDVLACGFLHTLMTKEVEVYITGMPAEKGTLLEYDTKNLILQTTRGKLLVSLASIIGVCGLCERKTEGCRLPDAY